MRYAFHAFQLPRNPLARLGLVLLGVLLLLVAWGAVLVAFVGVGLALAGRALWLKLRGAPAVRTPRRPPDPNVIEGEFRVVSREHERESIESRH